MTDFFTFYPTASKLNRIYFYDSDEFTTASEIPKNKCGFYMTKGYDATDDGLKQYAQDLYTASQEIMKSKALKGFNYTASYQREDGSISYRNHHSNVQYLFKLLCKNKGDHPDYNYMKHEPIDSVESEYMESTFNAGLMYCQEGTFDCHGYDFSNYYASILASENFRIPTGRGTEQILKQFPDNMTKLKTGFYRVKIESNDERVKKVFSFSSDNVYTSDMVKFAFQIQARFCMTIELIQDGEPNAYIYLLKQITNGKRIFGEWFKTLSELKKELPKNMSVKMLLSSLWGHLSRRNTKTIKESQAEELNIGLLPDEGIDHLILDYIIPAKGEAYYKLLDIKKPYLFNLRLKPWITSYGRIKTAMIILDHLDDVVRVHTDGVVFTKPKDLNIDGFIPEKKTTGLIKFNNLNAYSHIDQLDQEHL